MHQLCVRSVTARRPNRMNEKMLNYHTFRFVIQYSSILRSITRLSIQLISINRLISWIRSSRFLLLFISFSAAHRIFTHRKLWLTWEHSVCFLTSHSPNSQLVQVVLYFHVFSFCYFLTLQEDLLIHGDSVYDIIDKQDHGSIQAELSRSVPQQTTSSGSHHHNSSLNATGLDGEHRMFLCRMNVSRNARRQMRFGDQKVNTQQQLLQLGHKTPLTNRWESMRPPAMCSSTLLLLEWTRLN